MACPPFSSRIIADVGISMGDEGKGRLIKEIIDELTETTGDPSPVSTVIKINGGANSGHTAGGLKLNLIPSAVIDQSVPCLAIGSGVVADPRKFWWEIRYIEQCGINFLPRLLIDERVQFSDLSHRLLDLAWEDYRANVLEDPPRGSTARGISPAYSDETGQWQIFFNDFKGERETFARKLSQRLDRALRTIEHVCRVSPETWDGFFEKLTEAENRANSETIEAGIFPPEEFDFHRFKGEEPFTLDVDLLVETYWSAGTALVEHIGDVRQSLLTSLAEGKYVIGEFGQSYWLDKRHGFSPNLTASHTYTPEFFQSAGIPLQPIHTIGLCKAYDTKVGTHLFLTQIPETHPLARKLCAIEYGTSTGRRRMVGWFDAVEKADTLRYGGFQDMMLNKLDTLSYSEDWQGGELLICTAYRGADGSIYKTVPRDDALRATLKPVYLQLPGWSEDISPIRRFADLPANAQRYVAACLKSVIDLAYEENSPLAAGLPNLRYIGVGPDPSQIIKDVPQTEELLRLA